MNDEYKLPAKAGCFLTPYLYGMDAAERDLNNGTITDCPFPNLPLSAKEWYEGYNDRISDLEKKGR